MNRQRVVPPPDRGPDGLKADEPRGQCQALTYNRYDANGAGGEQQCERVQALGSKYCLRHRKREVTNAR